MATTARQPRPPATPPATPQHQQGNQQQPNTARRPGSQNNTHPLGSTNTRLVAPVGPGIAAVRRQNATGSDNDNNGAPVHDIAFYEAVAAELPDSPALVSLLYTYRNATTQDAPLEQQIAEIDAHMQRWQQAVQEQHETEKRLIEAQAQQELEDARAEEVVHQEEINMRLRRLSDVFRGFEEEDVAHRNYEDEALREKREAMEKRNAERMEMCLAHCHEFEELEEARRRHNGTLELQNQRAKIEMEECLARKLLLTDQDHGHLGIAYQRANEREIGSLELDCRIMTDHLLAEEDKDAQHLEHWARYLNDRAIRYNTIMQTFDSMLRHAQENEHGLRMNLEIEETRAWEELCTAASDSQRRANEKVRYREAMQQEQIRLEEERAAEFERRRQRDEELAAQQKQQKLQQQQEQQLQQEQQQEQQERPSSHSEENYSEDEDEPDPQQQQSDRENDASQNDQAEAQQSPNGEAKVDDSDN